MFTKGNDEAFGPLSASWLDFTLFFEQTILGILPTGLLIATTPLYLYLCSKRPVYTRTGFILWADLAASISLISIEIASLVCYARTPSIRTDAALTAASLSCVGSLAIAFLLFVEYRHSLRPTALLSLYIIVSLMIDLVKSRSYFIRHELQVLGGLSAAAAAVKLCITILQEIPKRHLLINLELKNSIGKEATGGFLYRSSFGWLNSIFEAGFNSVLKVADLEALSPELASNSLYPKFKQIWEESRSDKSSGRLAFTCFRTLRWHFLAVPLPRLIFSMLTLAQPFLLQRILDCISNDNAGPYEKVGLLFATLLTFGVRASLHAAIPGGFKTNESVEQIAQGSYKHASYRLVTATRGVLIAAMADKQLRLPHSEAKKSAISTLMTADVEGIEATLPSVHDLWAFLIDIGFGLYFLSKFIRLASISIFAPFLFSVVYGYLIGKWSAKALAVWNANIQTRVSKMSDILSQQIPIRMMGLGPVFGQYAQQLRVTEMGYSKQFRVRTTTTMTGAVFIEAFTPVIILTAALFWTTFPGGFTALEAFPILALIKIVQMPLFFLIDTLGNLPRAWVCFNRIQAYLQLPEWEDPRKCVTVNTASTNNNDAEPEKPGSDGNSHADTEVIYEFFDAWINPLGSPKSILKGINLQILRSKVVALLGPMACGKSTFLRCLLGEASLLHGSLRVAKKGFSAAFCDQNPWLHNGTLQDNILGPSSYDEKWYKTVVERCQLLHDFAQLPHGDKTVVGSDGTNLSVGQRHRVSLARAVYSRTDVIVVDDVFSSQDKVTARAIVRQLLGPDGLLRRLKTTVILATHLSAVLDVSDEALVFDSDGSIYRKTEIDQSELKKELGIAMDVTQKISDVSQESESQAKSGQESHFRREAGANSTANIPPSNLRTHGDFGLYRFYFRAISKLDFLMWIASMLVVTFCDNFPNGYVRIWVDNGPSNNLYLLGFALIAFGRVSVGLWSQRLFYLRILPDSGEQLHQMLLDVLADATFNYICAVDSGDLLNRFSQDMNLVVQALPLAMYKFVFMLFSTFIELGFVLAGASYAMIALPFLLGVVYFIQKYYLRTSRQLRHLDLEAKSPLFICFKETANGLPHIRTYGWSASQLRRNLKLVDESQKPYYQMFCAQRWLVLVLELSITAVALVIVGVALNVKNSSSPAAVGLSYLVMINYGSTVAGMIQRFTEMEIALGSISRTRMFVEETPREPGPKRFKVPPNWPDKGKIELRNVTAKYNSDSVLTDISFVVQAGDKVALAGRSGSGKSSLLVTLLNFLDYSGSIIIDGVNINKIPRQLLRERITTITQTPVVIDDSVRYNLVPWDENNKFPDSIIKNTLRQLGLWEKINSKGGLQTRLENAGLSVAHLQLLCIARALLHHIQTESKIVLMDEATASLSTASTLEVQRVIKEAFQGCTVLNIAHWDSPLQQPDLEVSIDRGRLISARRTKVDSEDEQAAEERLVQEEEARAYADRIMLEVDQQQRQILAREQAFEAKLKETTTEGDGDKKMRLLDLPKNSPMPHLPGTDVMPGSQHATPDQLSAAAVLTNQQPYIPIHGSSPARPYIALPATAAVGTQRESSVPPPYDSMGVPLRSDGFASPLYRLPPFPMPQEPNESGNISHQSPAVPKGVHATPTPGSTTVPVFQFGAASTPPQQRRFATPHAKPRHADSNPSAAFQHANVETQREPVSEAPESQTAYQQPPKAPSRTTDTAKKEQAKQDDANEKNV